MSDNYSYNYLFIAIFTAVAILFPLLPIVLAHFVTPKKPSPIKNATYECGMETKGETWVQFRVQYYLFALLFVIFDIETIFVYPWAVAFNKLGLFAFVEMIVFLGILALGWAYAWKKGVLEWI
ncbi:MAG: NADH-quinone oxidoreductase subunit A [Candidatus Omnitrophica bacterium]|nr:NADH-quinone oxidoreductase subunit A [Candidatus Omnitrophota bacterium]